MEECPGVPLDAVIGGMSSTELDHIADQLLAILDEMHSYTSSPWNPSYAFSSIKEYLDYYRDMFLELCGPEYVDELFSVFPTEGQVYLTHGDLLPHNILVDGSQLSSTGRLPAITPSSGSIAGCTIQDG
ncbi:hypothetical protein BYT27DRAFT_7221340 [Phlegmacium glaucopus]|nr:hypothetical protein BYT27DRAFT_7221340 [Phlegmacium glaucopus]